MGKSLRAVVAMTAVVLGILAGSTQLSSGAAGAAPRPTVGTARLLPTPGGTSCPLETSRCTPTVPSSPPGPVPLAGVTFLAGCAVSVAVVGRRIHRARPAGRLADGVQALILRPPIPLRFSI